MIELRTLGSLDLVAPQHPDASGVLAQPKRYAVLVYLAVSAPRGYVRRDALLALFWPEANQARGRNVLRQTVYQLRQCLGSDAIRGRGDDELGVDPAVVLCDVTRFEELLAEGKTAEAVELYRGDFLSGFHVSDATPELEEWMQSEARRLRGLATSAAWSLAETEEQKGNPSGAAHWARRVLALDPLNEKRLTEAMRLLARGGDRVGALQVYHEYVRRADAEFGVMPAASVKQLATSLRSAPTPAEPSVSPPDPASSAPRTTTEPSVSPVPPRTPTLIRRSVRPAVAVAFVLVALSFGWRAVRTARAPSAPVLAVGRIQDLVPPDSVGMGGVLNEMLATSMARLNGLQVVANSRMRELIPRDSVPSRDAMTDAARRAGATEIIEGELTPLPERQLRLEIRRVDITRGLVRGGYRVSGTDRIALFDSVTSLIAADLRVGAPAGSLGEVSTRSAIAYRFYEEGLRAFYQFDMYSASRSFRAAIREDSAFAMATYYAWRSAVSIGDATQYALAARAVALASRASPRDRLLILTHVGQARSDVKALAAAESLATKYPRDPEALIRAGEVVGDLGRAIDLLDRAIALDSVAGARLSGTCRLCEALNLLTVRYVWADSSEAAERTLDRWRALRPDDATPWHFMAETAVGLGRRREAEAAERRFQSMGGVRGDQNLMRLVWNVRSDDLVNANAQCDHGLAGRDPSDFAEYRWYCTILLRTQGRYREALGLIRGGRVPGSNVVRNGGLPDRYHEAILDMEMGRALVAADQFVALATAAAQGADQPDGVRASRTAWLLTLAATAAVAGDDTIRARALVDTIEAAGRRSAYSRDPRLHHFVRGLLHARARQQTSAAREFRSALDSPTAGYTRINYELARTLLAMNRPADGIPLIRAVLHGGIEGPGTYLTRTETHELLAQLFDAAGQRDSAVAHYAIVERSWRSADPFLKPRYEAARRHLGGASASMQ
jgi:DNA-binding SARP family transcriptional activator